MIGVITYPCYLPTININSIISPYCRIYALVKRVSIASDNGLAPIRRQAIILTNAGLLSIALQWNFYQNTKLFIHENASENIICEMEAILSRGRWVKQVGRQQQLCYQHSTWGDGIISAT